MGLTTEQLTRVLTTRELVIRGEVQQIQQTPEQASDSKVGQKTKKNVAKRARVNGHRDSVN